MWSAPNTHTGPAYRRGSDEVLVDGVGGALEPYGHAHLGGDGRDVWLSSVENRHVWVMCGRGCGSCTASGHDLEIPALAKGGQGEVDQSVATPNGTAGLARSLVSGSSRCPHPGQPITAGRGRALLPHPLSARHRGGISDAVSSEATPMTARMSDEWPRPHRSPTQSKGGAIGVA